MADSIEETLQRHGMNGDQLFRLARKAADDALRRHGAFLEQERFEELVSYMLEIGCRYIPRFETGHHIALSTFLYRRMRIRYTDWIRTTLGDSRHPGSYRHPAGGHVSLNESDGPTWDDDDLERESLVEAAERLAAEHNLSAQGAWALLEVVGRYAEGATAKVVVAEAGLPSTNKADALVEDLRQELTRHGYGFTTA